MKTCAGCNATKPLSEFYEAPRSSDGRFGKCKECVKAAVRANRAKRLDYYHAYDRARFQRPERKAQAREAQRRMRARYPEKYAARDAVNNGIRDGRIQRQPCEICGDAKAQAHHEDYSRPLDVRWLCFKHHREVAHGHTVTMDGGST